MADLASDLYGLNVKEAADIVETSESGMFRVLVDGLSPELRTTYGASWHDVGGATASLFEELPVLFLNRVIGLGLQEPATEVMIEKLLTMYGRGRVPFMIAVSPAAQPIDLGDWLLERGFQKGSNWAKVIRGTETPPEITTDLRIEPVDEDKAGHYAAVVQAGFGMPDETLAMFEDIARMPNVYGYIAYARDMPAGVGTLLVDGDRGVLFNAATLPEYRRRGVQGAIMARRIRDGIGLGCRWFTTETSEDTLESPNSSYHNMMRTGFQLAYLRPNYVYRFE